jgi:hypothetical protein
MNKTRITDITDQEELRELGELGKLIQEVEHALKERGMTEEDLENMPIPSVLESLVYTPKTSDEEFDRLELEEKIEKRIELLFDRIFNNATISVFFFAWFMCFRLFFIWKMSCFQYLIFMDSLWLCTSLCSYHHHFTHLELHYYVPIECYAMTVRTL